MSLHLEIESVTAKLQSENGVRQQDYKRYRIFCSRMVRRSQKNAKLLVFFHGNPENVTGDNVVVVIQNILFESQRAYAYGMELQQQVSESQRKHHHSVQRFRKASKLAGQLKQIVVKNGQFSSRSLLEVHAYYAYLSGLAAFHSNSKWPEALQELKQARSLYQMLIDTLPSTSNLSQLYMNKINDLAPQIRYCLHQMQLDEQITAVSLQSDYDKVKETLSQPVRDYLQNKDMHHEIGQSIQIKTRSGGSLEITDQELIRVSNAANKNFAKCRNLDLPVHVRKQAGKEGLKQFMEAIRMVNKLIVQNPDLVDGHKQIKAAYAVSHAALYTEYSYLCAELIVEPAQLPPKPAVVPSKPIFFDIALEFIKSDAVQVGTAKPEEQKGLLNKVLGGWFGQK